MNVLTHVKMIRGYAELSVRENFNLASSDRYYLCLFNNNTVQDPSCISVNLFRLLFPLDDQRSNKPVYVFQMQTSLFLHITLPNVDYMANCAEKY